MADNSGNIFEPIVEISYQASTGEVPPDIIQRIWDTTAGWCQYTKSSFDSTPLSTETEPNHTDNLVAGTHQKLGDAL